MQVTEVRIDVPCADHMDHVAKLSPLKFRMQEDVVKIYSGKPDVQCTVAGTERLLTSRNATLYSRGRVAIVKRWSLPSGMFEWFAKMDVETLKRVTVYVTHCVSVEIDAFSDRCSRTTIIWKRSNDDERERERVLTLVEKLEPGDGAASADIQAAMNDPVWRE
jgi:hypothetical protein